MLARWTRPTRWLALKPFGDLQTEMDRFFGDYLDGNGMLSCDINVREDDEHVYIEAELPGLTKDDIEITFENNVLNVCGEKKLEKEEKEQHFHVRERRYGRFSRTFQLPTIVDESKVEATLKEGVLRLVLNKKEEAKPKRIDVKVN